MKKEEKNSIQEKFYQKQNLTDSYQMFNYY